MLHHSNKLLIFIGLATALCVAASSSAGASLPDPQQFGRGSFITGGIGLDESTAMKQAMKDWPIAMLFAEKDGQRADYVADVRVAVTDAKGMPVIETVTQGPFLLANEPPGTYRVAATLENKTLRQVVEVKSGKPVRLSFLWPAHQVPMH